MNDLTSAQQGSNTNRTQIKQDGKSDQTLHDESLSASSALGIGSKEVVGGNAEKKESHVLDKTSEIEPPKEVQKIGISAKPTTVSLPQGIKDQGIKQSGQQHGHKEKPSNDVPMSDKRIAEGLKKSVEESLRWLSEFYHRLKKLNR